MPCIWGQHNKHQLFINTAIFPVGKTSPIFSQQRADEGPYNVNLFSDLVDTGATTTCISKKVADAVGLTPIGKVPVCGVSGTQYHNNYLFHVGFVFGPPVPPKQVFQGQVIMLNKQIAGAELIVPEDGFQILLGMDILGEGSLAVEGCGTFSFCF